MASNVSNAALLGATWLGVVATLAPVGAHAKEASAGTFPNAFDHADTIVVTGSRIERRSVDAREPTIVVGSDLFESRGFTNVGDALETIPAFGPPPANGLGPQRGGFGSGQTFVDFFGLGSQRTLTLVNSRRFVSSNTASIFSMAGAGSQVDLNTIPTIALDRVETVAVGGAPIYGSDAIAGTVNILLRQKHQGIEFSGQTGISGQGDAASHRLGVLAGTEFSAGRGNLVGAFEWNRQEGLLFSDRERTAQGLFYTAPGDPRSSYRNVLITDRRIPAMAPYGAPLSIDGAPGFGGDIRNRAGNTLVFDPSGNLVPLDFGTRYPGPNASGGNGFSFAPVTNLLSPTERYLGYAHADYAVTDSVKIFAEFNYAHSKGKELRAQPLFNTALSGPAGSLNGNLQMPLSNPFLSNQARGTIASQLPPGQDFFYLGRANTDITTGMGSTKVELYRITGGLTGDFAAGDRSFKWEVVGNFGRSKSQGNSRELVQQNFLNALSGCTGPSSAIQTVSGTCVPFNPFGNQNAPAVAEYMTAVARPVAVNEQWVITADVTGEPFATWAGNAAFVLGYEHRDETANFDPGAFFYGQVNPANPSAPRMSYGRAAPMEPVRGGYNTDEVFGELQIPLISPEMGLSFLHASEIHAAGRYVQNSLARGDFTWTAGGKLNIVRDFAIRGNYTRAIRAPAITELFNPTSSIMTIARDPCDARFLGAGADPAARAQNCATAGLRPNFTSTIVDFTSPGSQSGNVDLENEHADSWTVGALVTPQGVPGLALSVDWVDISVKNAILSLNADQTMQACYDAASFPSAICSRIDRDAAGQVTFIRTGFVNAASYQYRGLLGDLTYVTSTPMLGADSSLRLKGSYQYIDKLEQRVELGDLTTLRGEIGYSKHEATVSATYRNGPVSLFTQVQYQGKAKVDADSLPNTYEYPTRKGVAFVSGSLSYDVGESYTLRFIVDNVFDTGAPYPAPAGGGLPAYWDGIMGRYFRLAISARL
jgi:outer membrane receptor protein involved in Fe transport